MNVFKLSGNNKSVHLVDRMMLKELKFRIVCFLQRLWSRVKHLDCWTSLLNLRLLGNVENWCASNAHQAWPLQSNSLWNRWEWKHAANSEGCCDLLSETVVLEHPNTVLLSCFRLCEDFMGENPELFGKQLNWLPSRLQSKIDKRVAFFSAAAPVLTAWRGRF